MTVCVDAFNQLRIRVTAVFLKNFLEEFIFTKSTENISVES